MVPAGLVLAAALAVAVGGTSLDGLGQVLDGPQVPRGQAVSGASEGDRAAELGLPTAPPRRQARTTPRRTTSAGRRPSPGAVVRSPQSKPQRPSPPTPLPQPPPATGPDRSSSPAVPVVPVPPVASAPAPVAAAPNGVRKLLDDTLRPVAPPVADAVGSLTDLLAPPL